MSFCHAREAIIVRRNSILARLKTTTSSSSFFAVTRNRVLFLAPPHTKQRGDFSKRCKVIAERVRLFEALLEIAC